MMHASLRLHYRPAAQYVVAHPPTCAAGTATMARRRQAGNPARAAHVQQAGPYTIMHARERARRERAQCETANARTLDRRYHQTKAKRLALNRPCTLLHARTVMSKPPPLQLQAGCASCRCLLFFPPSSPCPSSPTAVAFFRNELQA